MSVPGRILGKGEADRERHVDVLRGASDLQVLRLRAWGSPDPATH